MSRHFDRAASATAPRCLSRCTGCGACISVCPERALSLASEHPGGRGRKRVEVAETRCTGCGECLTACPRQALVMTKTLLPVTGTAR